MIFISKFRSNDLIPSKGKQIEFNSGVAANFFRFTDDEHIVTFECYSVADRDVKENIRVRLKLSPARGDYKIYQNEDDSPDLKDFFLNVLNLNATDNLGDYFAIRKISDVNYVLYYVPKAALFTDFISSVKDQFFFIPDETKKDSVLQQYDLQQIYYGAPGTGKSNTIKKLTADESVVRTTFHPDSDYSTFVGAYKPTTKEVKLRDVSGHVIKEEGKDVTENKIVYEFVSQAFLQAYIQAWKFYAEAVKDGDVKKQFLVIEEINRGNCAQIFGDLFQLLDRNESGFSDYPIHADNDMQKHLAHAFAGLTIARADEINACYRGKDIVTKVLSGELLLLPDNLYIWATMNTSDQSLFPIDSAFKRRWDWQYIPIADGGKEWKIEVNGNLYDWWQFLEKMNDKIGSITNSEDKKLGYFFCKTKDGIISAETFVGKVIFYIWNDVFKDFAEESGDLFRDSDGTLLTFNKFYTVGTDGKPYVVEEKIEKLLLNVGLTPDESQDVDSNEEIDDLNSQSEGTQRDRTKYSINGQGSYLKKRLPFEVVSLYVKNNPGLSAQKISDIWGGLKTMIRQIVITSTDYEQKLSTTSDSIFTTRYYELDLTNGEKIYVYNQFKPETITDFITKVNNQKWEIYIAKVEE